MSENREDGNNGHLHEDEISEDATSNSESQIENDDHGEEDAAARNSSSSPSPPRAGSGGSKHEISHKKSSNNNHHANSHSNATSKSSLSGSKNDNAYSSRSKNGKQPTLSKIPEQERAKTKIAQTEIKRSGSSKGNRNNGIDSSQNVNGSVIDSSISTSTAIKKPSLDIKDKHQGRDDESSNSFIDQNDYNSPNNNQDVKSVNKHTKDASSRNGNTRGNDNPNRNSSISPTPQSPTENVPKLSPSVKGGRTNSGKIGNRLSVTVPGAPFESGVNTECIQLLRQLWNVHEEAIGFLERIRQSLTFFRRELRSQENQFQSSLREKRHSNANLGVVKPKIISGGPHSSSAVVQSYEGGKVDGEKEGLESWIPLKNFIDGLKCISDNFSDIEKQFLTLSVFQMQCKLVLFAKVKHAKQQVTHDRLSIMHGIQQLISVTLHLLSSPQLWSQVEEENTAKFIHSIFQLTEVYNWCLESSSSATLEGTSANSSTSLNSNESPSKDPPPQQPSTTAATPAIPTKSKPSENSMRVFVQITAANRNDSPLLRLSLKPISGTRLLQILAQKRSTYAAHSFSKITLSTFYSDPAVILSAEMYECCFTEEDSRLTPLGKGFSKCPSLLGRAAVKKTENGDQRLSRSTRNKMYSYFHEVLWTLGGEHAEDLLLWGPHSNIIPLVLQPLDTFIALKNALLLGQHFQESNLSPMLPAFDSVAAALHSFSLLTNWDEKMREAFEETYQVKRPEHVALVSKPDPSQWATEIGSKFGQIVTSCIAMIDTGSMHNATSRSAALRMSANEEEPLGNEAQTFFRLEATLVYFKAWVVKRSKVWLNGWAIPQFLACSQREAALLVKLIKSRETILITRDFLLNHEDISIRLGAKQRQACAEDLRAALHQVQTMPDELLLAVGPVCRTLSLATLQSNMPPSNHWKGAGRGDGHTERPSSYVFVFISRVIEPVITASVELVPGPVQEAMGKQVVVAACDAWLQYILQRKIRFSEWGAVQLLRDFTAFREWIRTETQLDKDARKSILQLEILKTCEGVAYLLLRNPGDILGVGKGNRKNRRVAPSGIESGEPSPSADSTAEDDPIPAEMYVPNQQMWLELRLRRGSFMPPCC